VKDDDDNDIRKNFDADRLIVLEW